MADKSPLLVFNMNRTWVVRSTLANSVLYWMNDKMWTPTPSQATMFHVIEAAEGLIRARFEAGCLRPGEVIDVVPLYGAVLQELDPDRFQQEQWREPTWSPGIGDEVWLRNGNGAISGRVRRLFTQNGVPFSVVTWTGSVVGFYHPVDELSPQPPKRPDDRS